MAFGKISAFEQRTNHMSTVRLVIVLLVLGTVLLLAVQNTSPALPLVFLGIQTLALPLAVWLVLAIALGALTTLLLTALLRSAGGRSNGGGRTAYKYRPQPFYEPSPAADAAAREQSREGTDTRRTDASQGRTGFYQGGTGTRTTEAGAASQDRTSRSAGRTDTRETGGEWQAWTNLKSPSQWGDWESLSNAPKPEDQPGQQKGYSNWFGRKRREEEQQRVNESVEELSTDWDGVDERAYRPAGASPVEDYLDDITQGWEEDEAASSGRRRRTREFEVQQSPTEVYREGSMYSYRFRPGESSGQVDNIYAPPDDVGRRATSDEAYPSESTDPADYSQTDYGDAAYSSSAADVPDDSGDFVRRPGPADTEPLDEPEVADDGVVDADYRVIIPPYQPIEDSETSSQPSGEDWGDDDDWNDADDALTP
jgi:uncharacterized integral membrane protein